MKGKTFDISEFMEERKREAAGAPPPGDAGDDGHAGAQDEEEAVEELDVQKVVVEQLAAENAELKEEIDRLRKACEGLRAELCRAAGETSGACRSGERIVEDCARMTGLCAARLKELSGKAEERGERVRRLEEELEKRLNIEFEEEGKRNPNAIALLDRDVDIPDRFPGESRDHVIEVLKEGLAIAQEKGRYRRAKVLEGVLMVNEPGGGLERRREKMRKLFADNGNLVSGAVISVLNKYGIAYREGEKYLMPQEIMDRTY